MPVSRLTLEREPKYIAMRAISEQVDYHHEQARRLYPPYGTVGIGGADFDHLLKALVGDAYLRVLRRGGTPQEAHTEAVKDGNDCVRRWNEKTHKTRAYVTGAYELKRWNGAGEAEADNLHRHYLSLTRAGR